MGLTCRYKTGCERTVTCCPVGKENVELQNYSSVQETVQDDDERCEGKGATSVICS
jgi:hypothetical protein